MDTLESRLIWNTPATRKVSFLYGEVLLVWCDEPIDRGYIGIRKCSVEAKRYILPPPEGNTAAAIVKAPFATYQIPRFA